MGDERRVCTAFGRRTEYSTSMSEDTSAFSSSARRSVLRYSSAISWYCASVRSAGAILDWDSAPGWVLGGVGSELPGKMPLLCVEEEESGRETQSGRARRAAAVVG